MFDFLISFQVKENNLCPPINTRKSTNKVHNNYIKTKPNKEESDNARGNFRRSWKTNVFLAGKVGQKYIDLDSGLEWVCKGERGFIKVDGDDQSEMYNWELVESGGEPRNIYCDSEGNFRTDITIADYDRLLYDGKPIIFTDDVNRIVGICCSYWSSGSGYRVFSFLDHSGKTINLKLTVSGQDIVIERFNNPPV